jgi:hypothetical protein
LFSDFVSEKDVDDDIEPEISKCKPDEIFLEFTHFVQRPFGNKALKFVLVYVTMGWFWSDQRFQENQPKWGDYPEKETFLWWYTRMMKDEWVRTGDAQKIISVQILAILACAWTFYTTGYWPISLIVVVGGLIYYDWLNTPRAPMPRGERPPMPDDWKTEQREKDCWTDWCPNGKTKQDWKECYHKEARKLHPDMNYYGNAEEAAEKFKKLRKCDSMLRPNRD